MGLFKKIFKGVGHALTGNFGALAGDVLGFIGGKKNNSATSALNQQNINFQRETNALNERLTRETNAANAASIAATNLSNRQSADKVNAVNRWIHQDTMARQEQAAKNSIQWRMADAKSAGLHPLYAMGIQPASVGGSGVSFVGSQDMASQASAPQHSAPQASGAKDYSFLGAMGQNLSRALQKGLTKQERYQLALDTAVQKQKQDWVDRLQIEGMQVDNDYKRAQIARLQADQVGPPSPSISDRERVARHPVQVQASKPIIGDPTRPGNQPGPIQDYKYVQRADGSLGVTYSDDMKNASDDDIFEQAQWQWRNRIYGGAYGSGRANPPAHLLPKGKSRWVWKWWKQGYYPE